MLGQNSIIQKLTETIIETEMTVMNQRFSFYKMCSRDCFGQTLLPTRGTGYELLNKNMLQDSVDHLGNNLLKQGSRLNVNVSKLLDRACD